MTKKMMNKFTSFISKYTSDKNLIDKMYSDIENKYSSPNRHYHNLDHISRMLYTVKQFSGNIKYTDNMILAIWYHDIIYNTFRKDNEIRSAEFAEKALSEINISQKNIDTVKHYIIRTSNHFDLEENESEELKLFLDTDLLTLGSKPETYDYNTQQIRKEYKAIPDNIFNKGRAAILEKFLTAQHIYRTDYFRKNFENQARININDELQSLKSH